MEMAGCIRHICAGMYLQIRICVCMYVCMYVPLCTQDRRNPCCARPDFSAAAVDVWIYCREANGEMGFTCTYPYT